MLKYKVISIKYNVQIKVKMKSSILRFAKYVYIKKYFLKLKKFTYYQIIQKNFKANKVLIIKL